MACPRCYQRTYSYGPSHCNTCAAIVKAEYISDLTDAKDRVLQLHHNVMPDRVKSVIFELIENEVKK